MSVTRSNSSGRSGAGRRAFALTLVGAIGLMALGAVPATAAGTGTVDAQVTIARAAACVEVSTTAVDFGTLALGSENAAATPDITLTNCGDGPESLLASGTNATGGSATWTLVDSAERCADTLGTDRYHLALSTTGGAPIATLATENKDVGTLATNGSASQTARIATACPGSSGTGATLNMQVNYLVTNAAAEPLVLEELTMNQATADGAADFLIDGPRDVTIAPTCAGDPTIGCVGGVPVSPAPQVHSVGSNIVATPVPAQDRWDVTGRIALSTVQSIPVTIQGSSCSLTLNTAAGASPDLGVSFRMLFQSFPNAQGPKNYIALQNADVTGLETADFQLTGGLICTLAQSFSGFILGQLELAVAAQLGANLCGDPNSNTFIACPPLQ